MTVQLKFNSRISGIAITDLTTTIDELDTLDGTTSSTSGTYDVHFVRYQWNDSSEDTELHAAVTLTDTDDSDYPNVKQDLADAIAGLTADFGTASDIKTELSGDVS